MACNTGAINVPAGGLTGQLGSAKRLWVYVGYRLDVKYKNVKGVSKEASFYSDTYSNAIAGFITWYTGKNLVIETYEMQNCNYADNAGEGHTVENLGLLDSSVWFSEFASAVTESDANSAQQEAERYATYLALKAIYEPTP